MTKYNPYGPAIIVDSCKGDHIYNKLQPYNHTIFDACKGYTFVSDRMYDLQNFEASWWFDPRCVADLPISHVYPACLPVQHDARFSLVLYAPNYLGLLLTSVLYENKKDIMIEDQAGGMGCFFYYLHLLGYKNFNLIENFSQMPQGLFENLIVKNNIPCILNDMQLTPTVLNLVGYTYFIKSIRKETELVITYNNTDLVIKGEDENRMYRDGCLTKNTLMENKVWLCQDKYGLANAWCNKDKLDEFVSKLERYKAE